MAEYRLHLTGTVAVGMQLGLARALRRGRARLYQPIELNAGQEARYWSRVDVRGDDECWPWTHRVDEWGYGHFEWGADGRRYSTTAQRVGFTLQVGPIPDGLTIDHVCRVPGCQNARHMEPVPPEENVARGGVSRLEERGGLCQAGLHVWAETQMLYRDGKVRCRVCRRARWARANERRKARRRERLAGGG